MAHHMCSGSGKEMIKEISFSVAIETHEPMFRGVRCGVVSVLCWKRCAVLEELPGQTLRLLLDLCNNRITSGNSFSLSLSPPLLEGMLLQSSKPIAVEQPYRPKT